jgi:hypothetical protein
MEFLSNLRSTCKLYRRPWSRSCGATEIKVPTNEEEHLSYSRRTGVGTEDILRNNLETNFHPGLGHLGGRGYQKKFQATLPLPNKLSRRSRHHNKGPQPTHPSPTHHHHNNPSTNNDNNDNNASGHAEHDELHSSLSLTTPLDCRSFVCCRANASQLLRCLALVRHIHRVTGGASRAPAQNYQTFSPRRPTN